MPRLSGTASGALANLAAQGIPFALLIVVTPILLRSLGREQYGALVLFNLIPQIAGQLDLGLSTAATRGFTQHCARADRAGAMRLFHEALALLVIWGLLLGGAFYLAHPVVGRLLRLDEAVGDGSFVYLAAAIGIPLSMANGATLVPLRALERYGGAARVQLATGLAYWTLCTWWAARGATLAQLVALGTANIAVTTILLYRVASAGRTAPAGTAGRTSAERCDEPIDAPGRVHAEPLDAFLLLRPFVPIGANAFVAQVSSLATFHADKLLISALVSPAAAGAYTICTGLANKTLLVISSAATFTFPRSTHLHASGDTDGLVRVYRVTARVCAALAMAALVPMVGLAHVFLSLWIGVSFADDYALVLRLLAVGYALAASSVVAANVTMGIGKPRIAALFAVMGGLITIACVVVLTPAFGVAGAAAASLIGMSQTVVFNVLVSRALGPEAARTSWPLLLQLGSIGTPIALTIAGLSRPVHDWPSFVALLVAASCAFPLAWCWTFGRDHEWRLIRSWITAAR